ncbi:MAG: sigma-E factor negative regulatory protein [Gammaproteobacteria bacterium]|nr:sigma-E factor negative regulatory protein [Gammaproteobacteria bacterium]
MSGNDEESLSALMDGELTGASETRAIDALLGQAELGRRWARYHLIRAALRQELHGDPGASLHLAVRERLAREPAHHTRAASARPARRAVLRPVAGLALAASVAAVAILGLQGRDDDEPPAATELAASSPAESAAPAPTASLARATPAGVGPAGTQTTGEARPAAFDGGGLDRYLVRHNEYVSGGMRGILPYARIVGHEDAGGSR